MELKITDEGLRSAISEAILSQIDGVAREELLREAIKSVVQERTNTSGYGKRPSVIQESFASACAALTQEIVAKLVREDEQVREQLTNFARQAIAKLLADENHAASLTGAFADAFRKVMTGERY